MTTRANGSRSARSFERFPATVKGAFVLRGADRDPHQVRVARARGCASWPGRARSRSGLEPVTLDVAPQPRPVRAVRVPGHGARRGLVRARDATSTIDGDRRRTCVPSDGSPCRGRARPFGGGSVPVGEKMERRGRPRCSSTSWTATGTPSRCTYAPTRPSRVGASLRADGDRARRPRRASSTRDRHGPRRRRTR